jgi:hypothetical protein
MPQRLHEGQIRFPLTIVLDALAQGNPHDPLGGQAGQLPLHHRRLAHPGFATDPHDLAGA